MSSVAAVVAHMSRVDAAAISFGTILCRVISSSSTLRYLASTPGIMVFSLRDRERTIFGGAKPISDAVQKSTTNIMWSPTPNPAGITHAPTTWMSRVAQILSIGFLPRY